MDSPVVGVVGLDGPMTNLPGIAEGDAWLQMTVPIDYSWEVHGGKSNKKGDTQTVIKGAG